jgi:hypothetical protein
MGESLNTRTLFSKPIPAIKLFIHIKHHDTNKTPGVATFSTVYYL